MFRTPVAMSKMTLRLLADDASAAAAALARLSVIHLQEIEGDEQALSDYPANEFYEIFHRVLSRYKKITALDKGQILQKAADTDQAAQAEVTIDQLKDSEKPLKELWKKVSALEEQLRHYKEKTSIIRQLQSSLQRFLSLEIDLSRLEHESQFLKVMVGTVASTNRSRLRGALSIVGYVMEVFYSHQGSDSVIIVGSTQQSADVKELLKSADFRELTLPEEFHDKPQLIEQQLKQQRLDMEALATETEEQLKDLISSNSELLSQVKNLLHRAMPYAGLAGYLRGKGSLVTFQGWVPESRRGEVQNALEENLRYPFQALFDKPVAEELEQVPTQLKESLWITPFQVLVRQYGLPQYGEYDPGALFALSYTLMFGMMFGDIGHGAVIIVLAWTFRKVLKSFVLVGTLAGLSSVIFGFLYGSIFGYEHVLHPLWMSPMHDPQFVLLLALYWGIGFLLFANLLSVRNLLFRQQMTQALYSPQGIAGFVFYLSAAISLIWVLETEDGLPAWSLPVLAILMLVMLSYQWKRSSGGLFERGLVVFIEGLEIVISNMSATLSFLRVAAFALNHIALAAAVFALAAMLDTVGHWITIVLGNIFIIVLEGAIVAIQCLRLEYYEGFSRFFSGKGRLYRPLQNKESLTN